MKIFCTSFLLKVISLCIVTVDNERIFLPHGFDPLPSSLPMDNLSRYLTPGSCEICVTDAFIFVSSLSSILCMFYPFILRSCLWAALTFILIAFFLQLSFLFLTLWHYYVNFQLLVAVSIIINSNTNIPHSIAFGRKSICQKEKEIVTNYQRLRYLIVKWRFLSTSNILSWYWTLNSNLILNKLQYNASSQIVILILKRPKYSYYNIAVFYCHGL